ncbi:hypothetical protein THAOC_06725, partial [Thalassiosira oceanica]
MAVTTVIKFELGVVDIPLGFRHSSKDLAADAARRTATMQHVYNRGASCCRRDGVPLINFDSIVVATKLSSGRLLAAAARGAAVHASSAVCRFSCQRTHLSGVAHASIRKISGLNFLGLDHHRFEDIPSSPDDRADRGEVRLPGQLCISSAVYRSRSPRASASAAVSTCCLSGDLRDRVETPPRGCEGGSEASKDKWLSRTLILSEMSTDGAFAKAPWQLRWKRPQLDDVVVGISGEGDDVDIDSDNDDTNIRIGEGWVPISSSSAALTRNEARMVILELQRRDKLLVGRKGKIDELQEQIRGDSNLQSEPAETHADHSDPSSKPTPKNKNTKVITTDFSDDIAPPPPKLPLRTPESPVKSLISPSTWFKSITSPTPARNLDGRPPRSSSSNSNLKTPKSTSPTSFSTFMIRTPPPDDSPDHEFEDSPPQIMDTSTASSLLWEDMTLTSVTEEDAAAFRMYEKGKRNRAMSHGVEIDEDGAYIDGIRLNELDGFDHVILSVTIFSKKPTRFKSGEVVTMELLSTKNPPMIRSKVSSFGSLKEKQQHSKKVSISSSSSSPQTASKESSNVSAHDDEKRSEDRTRLLARRVLWWPATFQKETEGSDRGCPSFVSLGRTSVYRGTKKIDETPKPSQTADLNLANLERDDKEGIPRRKESQSPPVSPKEIDAARTNNERTADALDALRSLNFLLGGEVSTTSSAKFVEAKSSMDPNRRGG